MMHRYLYLVANLMITVGLFFTESLTAQTLSDPEAEYSRIRTLAFSGNLDEAELAARRLVNQFPEFGDARILLGRINAWQQEYDEAAAIIDTLLLTEPQNRDAIDALYDIRRWSRQSDDEALPPTNIGVSYSFDTFSEPYERFWNMVSVKAGHRFAFGPVSAGINVGNINIGEPANIKATEWQFDAEAWPKISDKNYAYISYAYSPGKYFPGHRAAMEIWQVLPEGWAVSLGANYYHFNNDVYIASASVEKYIGDWWFSGKGYFYFKAVEVTTSFYLNSRRYFNKTDYLQLTLGTGTAPDEPFDVMTDLERLRAYSLRLSYFDRFSSSWTLRVGAGYSYEKYSASDYRNRFEGGIGLIYYFNLKR